MIKRTAQRAKLTAAAWGKSQDDNGWFKVKAAGDDGKAEIMIYDVIGWPFVEADAFLNELDKIDAPKIKVRINSPGGDVFDGTAIYNALQDHPAKIETSVEGLAASMASIIALAGDERTIYRNAQYMIHNAWSIVGGDYKEMEREAELLKSISAQMAETYAGKTGIKQADVQTMMDETTWMTGDKAVSQCFMTSAKTAGSASARFNLSMYANAPEATEPNKRDLERSLMQDAGLSRSQARHLLQGGFDSLTTQDAGNDEAVTAVNNLILQLKG